ncbi:uncharacterized protein C8A04DRAFT_12680 [Dichotomopilus funicola]|uniref:Uncharacterized protein n=1 Tax=Dichotomopilus funicola TaxID=1934379 RepID=A0AAN6ZMZ5_9PEZI|nr:hypothetical protein C8A04DRAFT_12680 [Dichotomopilus funicola]
MEQQEQQHPSLGTNNPFRRKAPASASTPAPPPSTPSPAVPHLPRPDDETPSSIPGESALPRVDQFRHQLEPFSSPAQPPPATSFQKPKVVKKVRVQSPPSSPESSEATERFPALRSYGEDSDGDEDSSSDSDEKDTRNDPFQYPSSTGSADVSGRGNEPRSVLGPRSPPPNPFQTTLQDLEHGVTGPEQGAVTAPGARGGLDVGAFGRLLLTGQAGPAVSSKETSAPGQLAGHPPIPSEGGVNGSSLSRLSISETLQAAQGLPVVSQGAPEQEVTQPALQPAATVTRKKPPPPSSRHGKRIGAGVTGTPGVTKGTANEVQPSLISPSRRPAAPPPVSPSRPRPSTPSDVNKPLPLAPKRSPEEEATESVFEREAAGKAPEPDVHFEPKITSPPRPPTPPNVSHASSGVSAQHAKKPVPPPRRQPHGRSDSKATPSAMTPAAPQDETDSSLRRSSLDSTRSRSSSFRVNVHAPAPPPPRRPSHQSRASSSHVSTLSNATDILPATVSAEPRTFVASPPPLGDTSSNSNSNSASATPGTGTPTSVLTSGPTPIPAAVAKLVPPPPPPARNTSVRGKKPPANRALATPGSSSLSSSSDAAGLGRKVSGSGNGNSKGKEPPPPPRHRDRGNSRASADDGRSNAATGAELQPVGLGLNLGEATVEQESHAGDILADLDALQREVDALRGQVGKE